MTGQAYVEPDGSRHWLAKDYIGKPRDAKNPHPGPFAPTDISKPQLLIWPPKSSE